MSGDWEIQPEELRAKLERGERVLLLDVREPFEHALCRLDGAELIPLAQLPLRARELGREEEVVAYCHTGNRSLHAALYLRQLGFRNVRSLAGGIDAWAERIDSRVPRY